MKPIKKVLFLIEQAGTLLQMPRSHVRTLGNAFDTIASHSYHVSMMAYCIARMEGLSHKDGMKALSMGPSMTLPREERLIWILFQKIIQRIMRKRQSAINSLT